MWTARIDRLPGGEGLKIAIDRDGAPIAYQEVLQHWQSNQAFRSWFAGLLESAPFKAFRWETPAITEATAGRPFECVVLDAPGLVRKPNGKPFAEHFQANKNAVIVEFPSLGRDAILVVPCPRGPHSAYVHIGAFLREAPAEQVDALWRAVGAAMERRLGDRPVWLSTAGGGVAWLHVRLDDRPKYYHYASYRRSPQGNIPRVSD